MKNPIIIEDNPHKKPVQKIDEPKQEKTHHPETLAPPQALISNLQQQVGNRAVQRLVAQRASNDPYQLDDDTAGRINSTRGSGMSLESTVQQQMETSLGQDLSDVRIHNSQESAELSQQLHAKAFTTGNDIFFNEGQYQPSNTGGKELLAHELTHVVQQSSGNVNLGGQGMMVNSPEDTHEKEADMVAKSVLSNQASGNNSVNSAGVQAQELPGDPLQKQGMEEEEEIQMQEMEEEELQMQEMEEEELQMQEMDEEEEVLTKRQEH